MNQFNTVLSGAVAAGSFVVALFFLRFWRTTGDRFFLYFAMSFALEAVNRAVLGMLAGAGETQPAYYLIRLLAYALILVAIIDKNRPRRLTGQDGGHE
jgi:hypothetical protein